MRTKTEKALHAFQALNQANSDTNETDNDESQNQRIIDDSTDKRPDPRDGRRDERTNIAKDGCDSSRRFGINNLLSYLN